MGLGNPGSRAALTRHDVGFEIVRTFAARHGLSLDRVRHEALFGEALVGDVPVAALLPQTYMNASGRAVAQALAAHPAVEPTEGLLVLYDDLDLPLGRIRLRAGGRAGGHRGMASVLEAAGSDAVPRLRFGIGRPPADQAPRAWVLEPFEAAEIPTLAQRIGVAADAVLHWVEHGVASAMDRYNAAGPGPDPD